MRRAQSARNDAKRRETERIARYLHANDARQGRARNIRGEGEIMGLTGTVMVAGCACEVMPRRICVTEVDGELNSLESRVRARFDLL